MPEPGIVLSILVPTTFVGVFSVVYGSLKHRSWKKLLAFINGALCAVILTSLFAQSMITNEPTNETVSIILTWTIVATILVSIALLLGKSGETP